MKYLIIILLLLYPTATNDSKQGYLPYNNEKPFKQVNATVYAYNTTTTQCDSNPNITASGYHISDKKYNVIANNCLSFGSYVNVNGILYIVLDRMNKRYGCNDFDILMNNYNEAIKFGKQYLTIKIYEF